MKTLRELLQDFIRSVDRSIEIKEFIYAKGLRHGSTPESEELVILRSDIIDLERSKQTINQAFDEYS